MVQKENHMEIGKQALKLHSEKKGKIEIISKVSVKSKEDLALAYSPGVAAPCMEIADNREDVYKYTSKGNLVAVVSDGSAVLGLGNIGPEAGLPVMEGKSILFKGFANVDSMPLCVNSQDVEDIIKFCKMIEPTFGGINLEDISAPRCVEIERRLKEEMDIPIFHDDQHGTAIVTTAAIINACKLTGKKVAELKVIMSGTGAAGSSIARMVRDLGVKQIYAYDINGVVMNSKRDKYSFLIKELLDDGIIDSVDNLSEDSLAEIMKDADVFIGVSIGSIVTSDMIATMNENPFVFAMANPTPEIMPEEAQKGGAKIIGTGRSDFPNQINNVLAFPGIFRGALDCGAKKINEEMKLAAAIAIASVIPESELRYDYIIPSPFDENVVLAVSKAVAEAAKDTGVLRN